MLQITLHFAGRQIERGANLMRARQPPNIAIDSFWAVIVVSFLAGPVFQWLLFATSEPPPDSEFPVRAGDIAVFLYLFPIASALGLAGAVPAAVINALVVASLAKRHIDGALPATISAAICGVVIPVIAFRLLGSEIRYLFGEHTLTAVTCLALTGVLMGMVHWRIAVRPQESWRLNAKSGH